ncbi:MAG: hypothetical protein ACK5JC_04945 [Bacteroidota bacterium]
MKTKQLLYFTNLMMIFNSNINIILKQFKVVILFLVLYFININSVFSNDSSNIRIKKNSIYFEIFGNGMIGSFNYERLFFIKKQLCYSSIGGLYLPREKLNSQPPYNLFIPLRFNLIFGKTHQYTPGIGLTYEDGLNYSYSNYSGSPFEKYKKSTSIYLFISPIKYQASGFKHDIFFGFQICWFQRIFLLNKENLEEKDIKDNRYSPFIGFHLGKFF